MPFSFDDQHIGRTVNNSSLSERLVPRPSALGKHEWYVLAARVARLLNTELETAERMKRVDGSIAKQLSTALSTISQLQKRIIELEGK